MAGTVLSACGTDPTQITMNSEAEFIYVGDAKQPERLVHLAAALVSSADQAILVSNPNDASVLNRARSAKVPALPNSEAAKNLVEEWNAETSSGRNLEPAVVTETKNTLVLLNSDADAAETHLLELAGATVTVTQDDPRTSPELIESINSHDRVIVAGLPRYPSEVVFQQATVAGDRYLLFDDQHFTAMYGHPSGPALGVLGEQGPKKSVARVRKLVAKYEASAPGVTFQPSFEIITTITTAGPGKRKDYSARTPVSELRPLVDIAKKEGITVILDLQPGRASMLEQAKYYEELLLEPHVGLALDPEWKLGKKGKPLQRIGHVNAKQINEVSAWLAKLTRENALPQKMFVLHQFQTQMIRDRKKVRTDHPELATVIHVDGQGPTAAKISTWNHIRKGAPKNVHWGWKNFVDEDVPMLNTKQTWKRVKPHPALITYQ